MFTRPGTSRFFVQRGGKRSWENPGTGALEIHRTFSGGFPVAGVGSVIEYPVPLFVHNTFIEAGKGHVVKGCSELRGFEGGFKQQT
jgi:hypothetical protein